MLTRCMERGCYNLLMDIVGSWNIRGLDSPKKHSDVKWILYHYNIGLFGLLETRVRDVNFHKVFPNVCNG